VAVPPGKAAGRRELANGTYETTNTLCGWFICILKMISNSIFLCCCCCCCCYVIRPRNVWWTVLWALWVAGSSPTPPLATSSTSTPRQCSPSAKSSAPRCSTTAPSCWPATSSSRHDCTQTTPGWRETSCTSTLTPRRRSM